ncbi:hypothetical protein RRG08_026565 [Elysia crispata]|uniref:Uncharacterized protein n=1 Tax=Elysia crispata TaxID=231223 RepID=A0AAE0Y470_9GAST|nr:hypothetical protein RRG08_026565 [Elysia crispata]
MYGQSKLGVYESVTVRATQTILLVVSLASHQGQIMDEENVRQKGHERSQVPRSVKYLVVTLSSPQQNLRKLKARKTNQREAICTLDPMFRSVPPSQHSMSKQYREFLFINFFSHQQLLLKNLQFFSHKDKTSYVDSALSLPARGREKTES